MILYGGAIAIDERFRGCTAKYHVIYHLWGFLGQEIQILGFQCFWPL